MNPLNLNDIQISDLHNLVLSSAKDSNDIRGYGRRFTVINTSTESKEDFIFKHLVSHAKTLAERAETPEELNEVYKFIGKLKIVEGEAKSEYKERGKFYRFRSLFHQVFGGAFLGSHLDRLNKAEEKLLPKMKEDLITFLKTNNDKIKLDNRLFINVNNENFIVNLIHNDKGLCKLEISNENDLSNTATIELLSQDHVTYTNLELLSNDTTPLFYKIIKGLNLQKEAEGKTLDKFHYTKIELKDGSSQGSILKISKIKQGRFINKTYTRKKQLGSGGMGTAYQYVEVDRNGNRVANAKPKVIKIAHDRNSAKLAMSSGHKIMEDQYVDLKGKSVSQIPGLIKPTKSQIGDIALMSLYGNGHAGIKENSQPNELNESINFIKQVCFGLNHMHTKIEASSDNPGKRALVHRDIKGENIFCRQVTHYDEITQRDITVMKYGLADFDGAHEAHVDKGTKFTHTQDYISLSDVMLISDEKIDQDEREAFNKSLDVYALGISIREFITGVSIKPFRSDVADNPSEASWISSNYKNLSTQMSIEDLPIDYRNNLNNAESVVLQGLVNLCNSMTLKSWEDRPTIGNCLVHLQNLGIELPTYPA